MTPQPKQSEPLMPSQLAREAAADFGRDELCWDDGKTWMIRNGAGDGNPLVQALARFEASIKEAVPATREVVADAICIDVAELPDRSSPEDWPEAMLVTSEELREIVLNHLASTTQPEQPDSVREALIAALNQTTQPDYWDGSWEQAIAHIQNVVDAVLSTDPTS